MKLFKNRSWSLRLQTVPGASRSVFLALLVSGFWILGSIFAPAIIDQNNNGVSDIWEIEYNNGQPVPNTFDFQADPDGDGWDNLHEADAGTDPTKGNPPTGIIRPLAERIPAIYLNSLNSNPPIMVSPEAESFTWSSVKGKQYRLEFSTTLTPNWLPVGDPMIGTGDTMSRTMQLTQADASTPSQIFWRIGVNDIDADADQLTNSEEARLGTDPNNPTTLAGIPDLWLAKNFTQILLNGGLSTIDPNGDLDGDSLNAAVDADPLDAEINWPKAVLNNKLPN